ncbi:MAG: VWA domain-containing protein [Pirellulaceae bacterium]|nr:VWA domain-containing protein [Pirellulaceae bacterium]
MIARFKLWWQIKTGQLDFPWEQDARFWVISLVLHIALLVGLSHFLLRMYEPQQINLVAPQSELLDLSEQPISIQFDEMKFEEIGENLNDEAALVEMEQQLVDDVKDAPLEVSMPVVLDADLQFEAELLDSSADFTTRLPLKGNAGVAVTGAAGAIDRITQEILRSLDERKTTVVWLFDQSASLMSQRAEIRSRFDRIYRELHNLAAQDHEAFRKHGDEPLLTSIYGFGNSYQRMTSVTNDTDRLLAAIDRIERDDTGLEYVFSAVIQTVNNYKTFRGVNRLTKDRDRNVMIVIVSDEAGDDIERIDEAVELCTRWQIPVYVIGVPAPFGREETMLRWIDPDPRYDQTPQWAMIHQGPESVMSEVVKLDFADGDPEEVGAIDSGFGPFGLTRLAYESGGIYFTVHPNRRVGSQVRRSETENYTAHFRHFFEPEAMRAYRPDYVSHRTYMQQINSNRCRMALVQAAQISRVGTLATPVLRFERFNEGQFVNTVSLAQRNAAILEPKLNQLYETLRAGEKSRADEISPRWRAGYDLAYGRVMAQKVRVESYNGMLALIKTRLTFQDTNNNTWTLAPADSIQTGSQMATMADKARKLLQQVVEEHPGTPWAMLAQKELSTPLGWEWKESFTQPPPTPREIAANNNNSNMAPNPQPQANANPPPRRPPPRL